MIYPSGASQFPNKSAHVFHPDSLRNAKEVDPKVTFGNGFQLLCKISTGRGSMCKSVKRLHWFVLSNNHRSKRTQNLCSTFSLHSQEVFSLKCVKSQLKDTKLINMPPLGPTVSLKVAVEKTTHDHTWPPMSLLFILHNKNIKKLPSTKGE